MTLAARSPTIRTRALLDLRAADLVRVTGQLAARSGQLLTFSRAGGGTSGGGRTVDALGRFNTAVENELRFDTIDTDADGVRDAAAFLLERASTNLVERSSNFGATWTATNAPTRVAAAHTASGVTLDLIGDTSGASAANYNQVVMFTGNSVKAISVVVKQGTAPASLIRLNDGADRLLAQVGWTLGLPVITISTGTYLGYEALGDGVFRLFFATTAVTAANTNTLLIYPAETVSVTGAGTGTVYVGGVQAEDNLVPSSLIDTPAAATQARVADLLIAALAFRSMPCTFYGRLWLWGVAQGRSDPMVAFGSTTIMDDAQNGFGLYRGATGTLVARMVNAAAHVDAASAAILTTGIHEVLIQVSDAAIAIAVDGGAFTSVAATRPAAFTVGQATFAGDNGVKWLDARLTGGVIAGATPGATAWDYARWL